MSRLSLRARIALGALLWTAGLFIIAGVFIVFSMSHHPSVPVTFHRTFSHAQPWIAIAAAAMLIGLLQVRRGISPIKRLRDRLGAVHQGREPRVGGDYPAEVQPLVDDLNTLLDDRARRVTRAIARAGDLAHGLKTPLAVLSNEAQEARRAGQTAVADAMDEQIDRMRRQIDRHLAHARSAASVASPGARTRVED
jgi:signal transduction histidine kinase